jgi:hypothetical protein
VTPTVSPTAQIASGLSRVLDVVAVPQPQGGPQVSLKVLLSGPAVGLRLRVYTTALVLALKAEALGAYNGGWNSAAFDGAQDLPPGLYFCRVEPLSQRLGAGEAGKAVRLVWIR